MAKRVASKTSTGKAKRGKGTRATPKKSARKTPAKKGRPARSIGNNLG